jgi:hypothetical protein
MQHDHLLAANRYTPNDVKAKLDAQTEIQASLWEETTMIPARDAQPVRAGQDESWQNVRLKRGAYLDVVEAELVCACLSDLEKGV